MGHVSIWHMLILLIVAIVVLVFIVKIVARSINASGEKGGVSSVDLVRSPTRAAALDQITQYAARGYSIVLDSDSKIIMSKKIPFNWVLAIVLLFIPIVGWISLLFMIFANKGKVKTVSIEVAQ